MDSNALAAMTGLPSGKKTTHRGRRSRGKGPKGSPSTQTHLAGIKASLATGDNQGAKLHALRLVNALHKTTKAAVQPTAAPMEPDADDAMQGDPMKGY